MSQLHADVPPAPGPGERRRGPRRSTTSRRPVVLALAGVAAITVLIAGAVLVRVVGSGGSGDVENRVALSGTSSPTTAAGTVAIRGAATGTATGQPATSSAGTTSTPARATSSKPGTSRTSGTVQAFGVVHRGSYHLGPVEWNGSLHNSCAPYPSSVQNLEGQYLAGVDNSLNGDGSLCDASALVTTRLGKTVMVRIVTTGVSKAPGDLDLSPAAYDAIHQNDPLGTSSDPRPMTWQLVKGPDNGPMVLQYQTGANPWWTSLWVRNPRLPVAKVEVRRSGGSAFTALVRGSDGTWTYGSGFGSGAFTLRITSRDGQVVTQGFASFSPGSAVTSGMQFR
jgi:expansin